MTSQAYLEQARKLDRAIRLEMDEIRSLEALATSCTASYGASPKGGTRKTDKLEEAVTSIVEQKNHLGEKVQKMLAKRSEITETIKNTVSDESAQDVLLGYYIHFKPLSKLADELSYSLQHIYRLREKGLKQLQVPA